MLLVLPSAEHFQYQGFDEDVNNARRRAKTHIEDQYYLDLIISQEELGEDGTM